jgi:phage replication O-like protein O
MKSPQKENGYTAIANEIMDALVKYPLPGVQMQCLLFIFRKTYGFNKKVDSISLTQFEKATNVDRRHIHRAIKELVKKRLIVTVNSVTKEGTKKTTTYRFNKRYKNWLVSPKKVRGSAKISKKVSPKKVKTKDTITKDKKNIPDSNESGNYYLTKKKRKLTDKRLFTFNVFWEKFNYKKGKADAADAWYDIKPMTNNLVNEIYLAAEYEARKRSEIIEKGRSPKWAQGWLTSRRWEDERPQETQATHYQPTAEELINA